ncbi:hypothetical protein [Acidipropionibacterium jensenii]|uniref:hypothetical protein n=1 Tax=Acidipropionibacterium jensenii TaxID=1749 RepID=UPI0026475F4D|nr:hypothetical protein [Acidipropionibacterium jensenii]MDN6428581.1 hypothetical protein [Propionibacterium sp.]MDN6442391.1 hypothetical protein [Acidipropionibacterium jensenii]MDN6481195.1 hypothetical protein [Acidipropionibacterium jensenii]MDN6513474.1 hypothetical protein [Acidipropionibacterium jensenii]MDN6592788.1 hypothetical protein [Acidipropionibacterium jensenii]
MTTDNSVNKIPIAGVLAILAQGPHPLVASTWRTYVSRGTAPSPCSYIGVTPMWDAAVVQQWADQREEDLALAAGELPSRHTSILNARLNLSDNAFRERAKHLIHEVEMYAVAASTPIQRAELVLELTRAVYDAVKTHHPQDEGLDGRDGPERRSLGKIVDAAYDHHDRMRGISPNI